MIGEYKNKIEHDAPLCAKGLELREGDRGVTKIMKRRY